MNREEFLKQRAIAHHIRTQGVTKVEAGEAEGSIPEISLGRKLRSCSRSRMDCRPFPKEPLIDQETGDAGIRVRKKWSMF